MKLLSRVRLFVIPWTVAYQAPPSMGTYPLIVEASQVAQWLKILPASAGDERDTGLIPGSGRSPGGGNGNLL